MEAKWWHDSKVKDAIRVIQDPSQTKIKHNEAWAYLTAQCEKLTLQLLRKKRSTIDPWELSPTWLRIANSFDLSRNTSSYSFALQYLTWDVGAAVKASNHTQVPNMCLPSVTRYEDVPDEACVVERRKDNIMYVCPSTTVPIKDDALHLIEEEEFLMQDHWDFLEMITKKELVKDLPENFRPLVWDFHKWVCKNIGTEINNRTMMAKKWRDHWMMENAKSVLTLSAATKTETHYTTKVKELWELAQRTVR